MSYPTTELDGTDLSDKSTQELRDLRDYLIDVHKSVADAQDPAELHKQGDSQLDELMKDTLDRHLKVNNELLERGELQE